MPVSYWVPAPLPTTTQIPAMKKTSSKKAWNALIDRLRDMDPHNLQFEHLIGKKWAGVWTNGDLLFLPGWKRGFEPGELHAIFYQQQLDRCFKYEADRLKLELERRDSELNLLEQKCQFYRRQLSLESHLGLMLANLAT